MQTLTPEDVGLSLARLRRIDDAMRRSIDQGQIAGAVTLVARHGTVAHFEAFGLLDIEAGTPLQRDAIFSIYSMTKPITAVAVLMLYEEGHFLLDDPVSTFIPEFDQTKVFVQETAAGIEVAERESEITIRHLLTHTSGLPYGDPAGSPVQRLYEREQILRPDEPLAQQVRRIAQLPLMHQPGRAWTYGVSTDVLGHLVEVVSGQPFDVFLRDRIFNPLQMVDTGFFVPREKLGRFATAYTADEQGGLRRAAWPEPNRWQPRPLLSGGGGLLSAASDYARFGQMLLNGGELEGRRLLGRKTVGLMLADHLSGRDIPFPPDELPLAGHSIALGGATLVDVAAFGIPGSVGSYTWGGAASTSFWIDPQEDLIGLVMLQLVPFTLRPAQLFQVLAYQALID